MAGYQRKEVIGGMTLYQANCLDLAPALGRFDHAIFDPPYEQSLHDAKSAGKARKLRKDGGKELETLPFAGIDEIRDDVVALGQQVDGWFAAFCTSEGIGPWAAAINASPMKYKRACHWIKPDSTPQLNGQCPAQGAEHFVTAWAGTGFSRWNAGGKRGVYTEMTNPKDRHGGHPTEKPWRLMRSLLFDFTNPGDLIADFFMGGGTTLVAAALTGRRAIGIELRSDYFEMACHRVEKAVRGARDLGVQSVPIVQMSLLDAPRWVQGNLLEGGSDAA